MSKSVAYKHYTRIIAQWPKDALRPECQFQDMLKRRVDKQLLPDAKSQTPAASISERAEMEQVNILYSLLENRYIKKYPITGTLMTPKSKPTHYKDLLKEIEEAPTRNWWSQLKNKYSGMLRLS